VTRLTKPMNTITQVIHGVAYRATRVEGGLVCVEQWQDGRWVVLQEVPQGILAMLCETLARTGDAELEEA